MSLKKVTLYCSLHQGKELEINCETCGELICHNCTVSKHCRPQHKYDLVADTFERHKSDITASLDPVDKQMDMLNQGTGTARCTITRDKRPRSSY